MLKLYGFPVSNYTNMVHLALLEKGVAFDYVMTIPEQSPDFLAKSPRGKVPVLETPQGFVNETSVILEYLEETGDPATGLPIGSTSDNLAAAIAGETHEYTDMYPGMAKTARDEGFDEIADWFETLAKAERSHANRFQKALDNLDG